MVTTNKERETRVAVDRIVGFAKQFDEAHLNLACHAAFPLILTPDLLYQIWAHFVPEAPWTAVARVLLSRLCRQVGYEMYEIDIAVRNLLLKELKEQFGQERFDKLAEFLMDYVAQRLTEDDPDTQDLREAQEWTALAYTKPNEAAYDLAETLASKLHQQDIAELFRLTSLIETFTQPLKESGLEPLLVYAEGIRSFVRSEQDFTAKQFGNYQFWYDQAQKLAKLGCYPKVLESLEKAIEIQPDSYEAWNYRGIMLCDYLERYSEALASFNKAVEIQPNYYLAWYNRGVVLRNLRRYEEAIVSFDKAIEIQLNFYRAWNSRGAVLCDFLESYEEALDSFNKAVEIQPNYQFGWYNRGVALGKLRRYEEAIASYDIALKIQPEYDKAILNRSIMLSHLGQSELSHLGQPEEEIMQLD